MSQTRGARSTLPKVGILLADLGACPAGLEWVQKNNYTWKEAWENCSVGPWLWWFLYTLQETFDAPTVQNDLTEGMNDVYEEIDLVLKNSGYGTAAEIVGGTPNVAGIDPNTPWGLSEATTKALSEYFSIDTVDMHAMLFPWTLNGILEAPDELKQSMLRGAQIIRRHIKWSTVKKALKEINEAIYE